MIPRLRSVISFITCICLVNMASATSANVGLVMTTGEIQVDGSSVRGNAAIFAGSIIASGDLSSNLRFSDGTNAVLKPGAIVVVYREHSVLKQGVTMQRAVDRHPVLADGLKISGVTPNAVALIGVRDSSHIEVVAEEGESAVWTSNGNLLARIEPGKTLSFALNEAAAGTPANGVRLSGILRPHYLLTDEITNVTYQLQGADLEALIGASIEVSGTVLGGNPSSSVPQVVAVSSVTKLNPNLAAADGQQGGAAPAGQGPLVDKKSIIFLIAIAIAGTLIGLGASGAFSSGAPPAVTPATP